MALTLQPGLPAPALATTQMLRLITFLLLLPGVALAQPEPVPSFQYLPTGNGFGLQVFDSNRNAVAQFLERPYRYIKPNPSNPDAEGQVRRNLAYDTYFGLRAGATSLWIGKQTPDEVGYVDQTNVIRSAVSVGSLLTESFYFAPYGYGGNGLVMVLKVTNQGGSAATVTDEEIFGGIDLLGATEGILTEPAGGTTIACTARLAGEGKIGPAETVVAIVSGNGYKTLDEHPEKQWPEMVACDVDSMTEVLDEFRQHGVGATLG